MPNDPLPRRSTPPPTDAVIAALCTTFTGAVAILSQAPVHTLATDAYAMLATILTAIAAARGGIGLGVASGVAGAMSITALVALHPDTGMGQLGTAIASFAAIAAAIVIGTAYRTKAELLFGPSLSPHTDADATALASARAYLTSTQQIAHIGTWEATLIGPDFPLDTLRCSEELFRIYAFDPTSPVSGEELLARLSKEDRQRAEQEFSSAVVQRRPFDLEHRILRPDGSVRWVHERGAVHEHDDGTRTFLATAQDITELVAARNDLAESEARWKSMVTTAPDFILTTDLDRKFTYLNHPAPGFTWEDFKGKRLEDMVLEEYRRVVVAAIARARTTEQPVTYETLVPYPTGTRRMVSRARTLTVNDEAIGYIIVSTDVTEEREATERIRTQEARFRRLLENSWDAVILTDDKGRVIDSSPSIVHLLGHTVTEFSRISFDSLVLLEDAKAYAAAQQDAIANPGKAVRYTVRLHHKDGTPRWIEAVTVNRLAEPEVQAAVTNIHDVTVQRHAEAESRQKERFARAIFDRTVDINAIVSKDGIITEINGAGAAHLGYTTEQMIGKNGFSLIHEGDRAAMEKALRACVLSPDVTQPHVLCRARTASGKTISLEITCVNLLNDPSVHGVLLIARDVTERLRTENERRAADARFRAIIEHSFDLIHLLDTKGNIAFASPSFNAILGYAPEEIIGTKGAHLVHPDDAVTAAASFDSLLQRPGDTTTLRLRIAHKDGTWRTFDMSATNLLHVPEVGALVLNSRDVTDQIAASEAGDRQQKFAQAIVDNSIDLISILDADGTVRTMSASSKALTGYAPEELIGKTQAHLLHPEDAQKVAEAFSALISAPNDPVTYAYRMRRKDGTWGWFESVAKNMVASDAINGLLVNTRDVSEAHTSKETLALQEARFRGLVEHMAEGVHLMDKEGRITYATPAISRLLGYALDEFVGTDSSTYLHPSDVERVLPIIAAASGTHAPSAPYEVRIKKKDGTYIFVESVVTDLTDDPAVRALVFYTRDISERKRADARVKELDALKNKFIQVVSHQFRTPLNVVRWNLETLLAEELGAIPPVQKEFLRITYQANSDVIDRIHDLLTALDIEERRVILSKEDVSLDTLWSGVMAETKKACAARSITYTHDAPTAALPIIQADPEKLRIVFQKMADNAVSYTPAGGSVRTSLSLKDGRLRFAVTDTGIGVPAAEQKRIFERFYRATNSSVQKQDSSGLGLSIAKYFVEQHGGAIGLQSTEGEGSTFWFEIPVVSKRT